MTRGETPREPANLLRLIPTPEKNEPQPEGKQSLWVQMARYSELAFIFPACTVAGWLIGAGLDRWLHTSWLYLAGLIVGIIAGFVQLIRTVTSSESK